MSSPQMIFGPFRFNPTSRVLTDGETAVPLGARAIAILGALVETPGRLVSKAELLDRAWPGLNVGEANLKVQISSLRKVLGDHKDFIRAEASFGYRFVGDVVPGESSDERSAKHRFRAPRPATTQLGRDDAISSIIGLLESNRLVTIVGSGGIGKTTVALSIASELGDAYQDGICFVDLGRVTDNDRLYGAVTDALDFPVEVTPTVAQVLRALDKRRLLLILDCCEHVAECAAHLVEQILRNTDDVRILITTREILRIGGEVIWRLDPLDTPPSGLRATAVNILKYPSVQLFARAARQGGISFQIDDDNARAVAEICQRLDGIPLALELAASMVCTLGIDGVRHGFDERCLLLTMGRRTTVQRQRSLAATIDWSYYLLSEKEKTVLRRLTSFANPFTLNAAIAVVSDEKMDAATVREVIIALANKSFLNFDDQVDPPEYRLLDSTRAYASQAPNRGTDRDSVKERHARHSLVCSKKSLGRIRV